MDKITELLKTRLEKTFSNYFIHAVEHIVKKNNNESDILQVIINIQATLELLSKLYVLNLLGWKELIDKKYHKRSKDEIIVLINNGNIKTNMYNHIKTNVIDYIEFDDIDLKLLNNFQNYRNQVMHLGFENYQEDILDEAVWLIVRIINILGWQNIIEDRNQYLTNSLEHLLGNRLYNELINHSAYIGEAIDNAYDKFDEVKYCFSCGNDALGANDGDDKYKCLVCGCQITNDNATNYIDCPVCKKKGTVIYDALNISGNTYINGKCCACLNNINISKCKICKEIHIYEDGCEFCSDNNESKEKEQGYNTIS